MHACGTTVPLLCPASASVLPQSNYPPRFNYLPGVLLGQYDMKAQGPLALIRAGYDKLGDCYRLRVLNTNVTFMVGPRAQQAFFACTDAQLSQKEVYTFTVPVFGKVTSTHAHSMRRKMKRKMSEKIQQSSLARFLLLTVCLALVCIVLLSSSRTSCMMLRLR